MKIQNKLLIVCSLACLLVVCETNNELALPSFSYITFNEDDTHPLMTIEKDLSGELSKLCYEFYEKLLKTESILIYEGLNAFPPDKYFKCDLLEYFTKDKTYMGFGFFYKVEFDKNTTIALSYLDNTSSNGYILCYTSSLTSSLVKKVI